MGKKKKLQIRNSTAEFLIFTNQDGQDNIEVRIEDVISVELKAVTKTEDVHLAQAINYLEAYNLEVGLLINFGTKSLEFKRLINSKFNQRNQINQIKS